MGGRVRPLPDREPQKAALPHLERMFSGNAGIQLRLDVGDALVVEMHGAGLDETLSVGHRRSQTQLREQLRERLRGSAVALAPNRRESIVDGEQRAEQLKAKLVDHKEALDEVFLKSKDRNRRGVDQASP